MRFLMMSSKNYAKVMNLMRNIKIMAAGLERLDIIHHDAAGERGTGIAR